MQYIALEKLFVGARGQEPRHIEAGDHCPEASTWDNSTLQSMIKQEKIRKALPEEMERFEKAPKSAPKRKTSSK
jgi:hypothetical protein